MKGRFVLGLLPLFLFPGQVLACDGHDAVVKAEVAAPIHGCPRPVAGPTQAVASSAPLDLTPLLKSGEFRHAITAMGLVGMRVDQLNRYVWDKERGVVGAYRMVAMLRERFGAQLEVRVVGYGQVATMDFRSSRVTVWTAKGGVIMDIAVG